MIVFKMTSFSMHNVVYSFYADFTSGTWKINNENVHI